MPRGKSRGKSGRRGARKGTSVGARRGRPTALSLISTGLLQQELQRRLGMLEDLIRSRDELGAKLDALNAEISQFDPEAARSGGTPKRRGPGRPRSKFSAVLHPRGAGKTRRGRPRNPNNLVESLRRVMTGKTYSVMDVAQAVQAAGYKTTSPNFRTIVNQALISNPKAFKKIARGQYTAV